MEGWWGNGAREALGKLIISPTHQVEGGGDKTGVATRCVQGVLLDV